jgi:hypothetical protein
VGASASAAAAAAPSTRRYEMDAPPIRLDGGEERRSLGASVPSIVSSSFRAC